MSENKLVHAYSLCNTRTVLDIKKRIRYTNCLNFLVDAANLYFFILFFSTLNVAEMMNNNNIDYLPSG